MSDDPDFNSMTPIEQFQWMQKEAQSQQDHVMQADYAVKMEFAIFIGELSPDQLKTLHNMLTASALDSGIGFQLSGAVSGALVYKHGRSWDGSETPWSKPRVDKDGERELNIHDAMDLLSTSDLDANMRKYCVEPHDTAEGYFQCSNCKMFIQSLEDRMLRPVGPKGCEGCAQKAKFGG